MKRMDTVLGLAVLTTALLLPACRSSHDSVTGASAKARMDLPKLIASKTSEDGTSINLNNKSIGVKGVRVLADAPNTKNVRSLALKANKLGDEGVAILAESPAFQNVDKLFLWGNGVTVRGIQSLIGSAHFNHLVELNLMIIRFGD